MVSGSVWARQMDAKFCNVGEEKAEKCYPRSYDVSI